MSGSLKRTYVSSLRSAAATATRRRILRAAQTVFEQRGWSGTTLPVIADEAGVSPKTIQAQFGTKAKLLAEVVDFAVRGDAGGEPVERRGGAQAIRAAPRAAEALSLHAALVADINARAAQLAAVVEAGAAGDPAVVPLRDRMRDSMQFGVVWAAETVLSKPGLRSGLAPEQVEIVFQVAMAWSTYRTLASARGMSAPQIENWIGHLYERMLLP